jgi:hypothetical protein
VGLVVLGNDVEGEASSGTRLKVDWLLVVSGVGVEATVG